jgi:hypothetical protein
MPCAHTLCKAQRIFAAEYKLHHADGAAQLKLPCHSRKSILLLTCHSEKGNSMGNGLFAQKLAKSPIDGRTLFRTPNQEANISVCQFLLTWRRAGTQADGTP